MSKLGTIVELRTELRGDEIRRTKQKYPIVYENKSYYYCKEYGSDALRTFKKDLECFKYCSFVVISYESFILDRNKYLDKTGVIYVKVNNFKDDKFAEWGDPRVLYDIDKLKSELYREQKNYDSAKYQYEFNKKYMVAAEPRIADLKLKLESLQKQLEVQYES